MRRETGVEYKQAFNCLVCIHVGTTALIFGDGTRADCALRLELFTPCRRFRLSLHRPPLYDGIWPVEFYAHRPIRNAVRWVCLFLFRGCTIMPPPGGPAKLDSAPDPSVSGPAPSPAGGGKR